MKTIQNLLLMALLSSMSIAEQNDPLEPARFIRQTLEGGATRTLDLLLVRVEEGENGVEGVLSVLETSRHSSGITGTSPSLYTRVILKKQGDKQYRFTFADFRPGDGGDVFAIQKLLSIKSLSFDVTYEDGVSSDLIGGKCRKILNIAEVLDRKVDQDAAIKNQRKSE